MNVLIIENSELLLERYTQILSSIMGIKMQTITSISSKLKKFIQTHKPEAVIIAQDLTSDDYEARIQEIRKAQPSTIIIILTTNPFSQMKKMGERWGADYVLDKSNDFDKLPELFQTFHTVKS